MWPMSSLAVYLINILVQNGHYLRSDVFTTFSLNIQFFWDAKCVAG